MEKNGFKTKKGFLVIIAIIIAILFCIFGQQEEIRKVASINSKRNLSKEYQEITEEDVKTQSDKVEFSAFFTKQQNNPYAGRIKGKEITIGSNEGENLYFDLNISSGDGYLEGGQITIDSQNFKWNTSIMGDTVVDGRYVGNISSIKLQDKVYPGSQKLFDGMAVAIEPGNDINNYHKVSYVTLTGTYVEGDTRTDIKVVRDLTVDLTGEVNAQVNTTKTEYSVKQLEDKMVISFALETEDVSKDKLILSDYNLKVTAPVLNDQKAVAAKIDGAEASFDKDSGILTFNKTSQLDENGKVLKSISRKNTHKIEIEYPVEAHGDTNDDNKLFTAIEIPVETTYSGYCDVNKNVVSSTDSKVIIAVEPKGIEVKGVDSFNVYVNPDNNRIVSKVKASETYAGIESEKDYYNVLWIYSHGDKETNGHAIMKETVHDEFVSKENITGTNSKKYDISNLIENVGIYFGRRNTYLYGSDATVEVYNDDTNELIKCFTSTEIAKYNENNPYMYDKTVKHIRVETHGVRTNAMISTYQIKEIKDKKLVESISKVDFDNITGIYSYLTAHVEDTANSPEYLGYADYEEMKSYLKLNMSGTNIDSTKQENQVTFDIVTDKSRYNSADWKNGTFLLELPEDVVFVNITNVDTSNNNVKILACETFKENNKNFIKVLTSNDVEQTYKISVTANLYVNPIAESGNKPVVLYGSNEACQNYSNETKDIFDVNDNNNKEDKVGFDNTFFTIEAPNNLITNQMGSNYDAIGSVAIAPNSVEINPRQQTADININLINNYKGRVLDTQILGTIPFEGNTYLRNNTELGSQYSTTMTSDGIRIPSELEGKVSVYYTENQEATAEVENESNGWKTEPEDWTKVKRYLIIFNNAINSGNKYQFTYTIEVPENLEYNKYSYSEHCVNFAYETVDGKIPTSVEPTKLGIRTARKYNGEILKVNKENNKPVQGAVYKLTEIDENENEVATKLITTNKEGKILANGLYVDTTYLLEEVKAPSDYMLNEQKIKFVVKENENGQLEIEVLSNDKFKTNPTIENDTLYAQIDDEPKYELIITKYDKQTNEKIKNVTFNIESMEKNYITDAEGKTEIKGLELGSDYVLKEIYAEGYYLLNDMNFKVIKDDNGEFKFISDSQEFENVKVNLNNDEDLIKVEVELKDDRKPTLEINKVNKENNEKLENVQFKLEDENGKVYITNAEGKTEIRELEENKEYILKEVKAEGFYLQNISFKIAKDEEGKLKVESENEDFAAATLIDEQRKILSVTLKNTPIPKYKLLVEKVSEGSVSKKLQGATFRLLSEDVNSIRDYTTNEQGTIEIPGLYAYVEGKEVSGNYVLQEIVAPQGYNKYTEDIKFKVSKEDNTYSISIEDRENLKSIKEVKVENDIVKLVIEDKPLLTIKKTDSETGEPLAGADFCIYDINNLYGYAKDINGEFVGKQNEEGQYILTTDEEGKITLSLKEGQYFIVEVGFPEGYKEKENVQYFEIKRGTLEISDTPIMKINTIQDLVEFSNSVNGGNNYSEKTISLEKDLDFTKEESYDSEYGTNDTRFGDINGDGIVEGIKDELTKTGANGFPIIGKDSNIPFKGTFEGNGHKINNLYINSDNGIVGLFGNVENGNIQNLGVSGEIIRKQPENSVYQRVVGGIVGKISNGKINNCYNEAIIKSETTESSVYQGGIVGYLYQSQIENCFNKGTIIAADGYIGGIAGYGDGYGSNAKIKNSKNYGDINAKAGYIGGIVGEYYYGEIEKTANIGNITFENQEKPLYVNGEIGGIVGLCYSGNIETSYNSGIIKTVTSSNEFKIGGIVGEFYYGDETNNEIGNVIDCYNDKDIIISGDDARGNFGGIAGFAYGSYRVYNSYNTGDITFNNANVIEAGGIIGHANLPTDNSLNETINCYNTGRINAVARNGKIGGIFGNKDIKFNGSNNTINCYNSGDISISSNSGEIKVGGISGTQLGYTKDCMNTGNIAVNLNASSVYAGGIAGDCSTSYGIHEKCYNKGNIEITGTGSASYIGGLEGYTGCTIKDSINEGNITSKVLYGSYFGGIAGFGDIIDNCYNKGNLICKPTMSYLGRINAKTTTENVTNYYDPNIRIAYSGTGRKTYGTEIASEDYTMPEVTDIKSEEYFNSINEKNGVWTRLEGYTPKLLIDSAQDSEVVEISMKNEAKTFEVTTEVYSKFGLKGGTISGEGQKPYESIRLGNSNLRQISMIPYEGYEISDITINGTSINYDIDEDGTYKIPAGYFTNVNEDKHILVKYIKLKNTLTINKVDADTGDKLAGAKFNVQISPENPNAIFGELNPNADYYFVEDNGAIVPNNLGLKTSTNASSYIEINLENKQGEYSVVVNADTYGSGLLWADVTENTDFCNYDATNNFLFASNFEEGKDYASKVLTGGRKYYLHLGYTGGYAAKINNIKLVKWNEQEFNFAENLVDNGSSNNFGYFVEEDGKIKPNSLNVGGKPAYSYVPMTLENGNYLIKLNAKVGNGASPLFSTVNESTARWTTANPVDNFMFIYGVTENADYSSSTFNGGSTKYLHLSYMGGAPGTIAEINSIKLYKMGDEPIAIFGDKTSFTNLITDENGQIKLELPFEGEYTITEIEAPENYDLSSEPSKIYNVEYGKINFITFENNAKRKVIVHHYLKDLQGNKTTIKVAEDEEKIYSKGQAYETSPKLNLENLSLEKINDTYVIPEEANGIIGSNDVEVNYYYETSNVKLTIHHLLKDTQTKLVQDEEIIYSPEINIVDNMVQSIDINHTYKVFENTNYKDLINTYNSDSIVYNNSNVYDNEITFNTDAELNYYYTETMGTVNAKYLEYETERQLEEPVSLKDKIGKQYRFDAKNIPGFTYVLTVGEPEGEYKKEEQTVIFYYKQNAQVKVNHIERRNVKDEQTGETTVKETLLETKTTPGVVGEVFKASSKNFPELVLVESPENETIVMRAEEQVLNYYYSPVPASVIEKHIDVNTNKELYSQTHEGIVGQEYNIIEKQFTGYDLVESRRPTNANSVMTKEPITVTYYYVRKMTVITKYTDEETNTKVFDDVTQEGHEGDSYTTVKKDKEGYECIVPAKTNGFMTPEVTVDAEGNEVVNTTIIVEYKYRKIPTSVIEKHIDVKTNKELYSETHEGVVGQEYNIQEKQFTGYDLVESRRPTNANSVMTKDPITVTYYYVRKMTVITKYTDEETNTKVFDDVTQEGHEGDSYTTIKKDKEGYECIVPAKTSGIMTPEVTADAEGNEVVNTTIIVEYKYRKIPTSVIEKHIDVKTNKELYSETHEGVVGQEYNIQEKQFTGYDLVESRRPTNANSVMTKDPITVTYYYVRKMTVITKYTDEETNTKVFDDVTQEGHEGDSYTTIKKDKEGYECIVPAKTSGIMTPEVTVDAEGNEVVNTTIIVEYKYKKIPETASVTEKHIDVNTNKELYSQIHEGVVGQEYNIQEKQFTGYDLVESRRPTNANSVMTKDPITVTYYYVRKMTVITKYTDEETNTKVFDDVTQEGHEGDSYTTVKKDKEGYECIVPAKTNGFMTPEVTVDAEGNEVVNTTIIVEYKYRKTPVIPDPEPEPEPASVIEKHIDVTTNKELYSQIHEGVVGQEYNIQEKQFTGYDLVESRRPTNANSVMTKDPITVTYYYIRKMTVITKYTDEETNTKVFVDVTQEGHEGDSYTTVKKDKEGYECIVPAKTNGFMTPEVTVDAEGNEVVNTTIIVEYKYRKIPDEPDKPDEPEKPDTPDVPDTPEKYNLKVDKIISKIILDGKEQTISNGKLAKTEIHKTKLKTSDLVVEYTIKVSNTGEKAGYATLTESIPEGFEIKQEENADWSIEGQTARVKTPNLKSGEEKEYKIVLHWVKGDYNIGVKINTASLTEENKDKEIKDDNPEDNTSTATLIVTISTGELLENVEPLLIIATIVVFISALRVAIKIYN